MPPAISQPTQPRFAVVLDPAHGGTDSGATLGDIEDEGLEKNYTLALANRLRALLNTRDIHAVFTRDADLSIDPTARAETANQTHAAACVLLHATASGNGIHLFTSSLPATSVPDARRAFLGWSTAQSAFITQSLRLESDIDTALTRQHIPVLLGRTSLAPLDSLACPAVAVEVAPLDANTPPADAKYREQIAQAIAQALTAWRSDWRVQP